MKHLNKAGEAVKLFVELRTNGGAHVLGVWFFDGGKLVASADRLGPAGWFFISPYIEQHQVKGDAVHFNDNAKSLKIRAKLDAYLDYFQNVKGILPDSVVFRREQLSACGALPG